MDFLFNAGTSYSGTTPFYYTCIRSNQYCHTGNQKETGYLIALHKRGTARDKYIALRHMYSQPNHLWQRVPGREFNEINDTIDFYSEPFTIDKYISYYTRLGERVKGSFKSVGDFTNHNWDLSEEFLIELRERMKGHFDNIRVTCQLRDPIRRYWSRCGSRTRLDGKDRGTPNYISDNHTYNFQEVLKNATVSDGDPYNQRRSDWKMAHYAQGIQKFQRVFGEENVYPMIMEEFWDESRKEEQCRKLSDFLQYKIKKIHQNAYVPDRGSSAPMVPDLFDQHSDKHDMTPELYEWALKYMGFFYDDWEEAFGSIPKYWKC